MKKSLFVALFLIGVLILPAKSAVTVEEMTDTEHLINSGYSQMFAEDVFVQKNRLTGQPIEPLYEKSENRVTRILKTIYAQRFFSLCI